MPRIRPRCLLLDTDVIVYLHSAGLWTHVTQAYDVTIPSFIVHEEAQFFRDHDGDKHPIDLPSQVESGSVFELAATPNDLSLLLGHITRNEWEGLHDGEREALALVLTSKYGQGLFCSGDKTAIETLAALGFAERGVSLQAVLRATGSDLRTCAGSCQQYTEEYFKKWSSKGSTRMMTGLGLTSTVFDKHV